MKPSDAFLSMLVQVAGNAFAAAGYTLQNNPTHQGRGLFRYQKRLPDGATAYVEFQMLALPGAAARFRITLLRSRGDDARDPADADRVEIDLSRLLWDVFEARILDGPDHWWTFGTPGQLGFSLAEAGKLAFGFGIPWLEGGLLPSDMGPAGSQSQ